MIDFLKGLFCGGDRSKYEKKRTKSVYSKMVREEPKPKEVETESIISHSPVPGKILKVPKETIVSKITASDYSRPTNGCSSVSVSEIPNRFATVTCSEEYRRLVSRMRS